MAPLSFVDADRVSDHDARRSDAAFPDEREALDAYSLAVTTVAERLAPSVANLRVSRRLGNRRTVDGGGC